MQRLSASQKQAIRDRIKKYIYSDGREIYFFDKGCHSDLEIAFAQSLLVLKNNIMSATLSYEPVKPTNYKSLGDDLKFILIEKFNLRNSTQRLTDKHIPYLEGLVDAGIKDANILIQNINKYDKVDVFLSY